MVPCNSSILLSPIPFNLPLQQRKRDTMLTQLTRKPYLQGMGESYHGAKERSLKSIRQEIGFGKLFTTGFGQAKLKKAIKEGWLSAGIHFAPYKMSGKNVCPFASPLCVAGCLNTSGHGGIGLDSEGLNDCQRARIARTKLFYSDRGLFWFLFEKEMGSFLRAAKRHNLKPSFRPNLTSDLRWEAYPCIRDGKLYDHIFAAYPEVMFMDYTAWSIEYRDTLHSKRSAIPNYHLTFSLKENNDRAALQALKAGVNVAVVLDVAKGEPMPAKWSGRKVIDGDDHDLRFLDQGRGVFVGLRPKGKLAKNPTAFVRCQSSRIAQA